MTTSEAASEDFSEEAASVEAAEAPAVALEDSPVEEDQQAAEEAPALGKK